MGIMATDAAEVVERTKADVTGALTDLRQANEIQMVTDGVAVWVNVDGICLLRIAQCPVVISTTE